MKRTTFIVFSVFASTAFLASCSFGLGGGGTATSSSSSSSEQASDSGGVLPTHNVSYMGTIEDLGSSIYQQGTHRLVMSDGQFILLQSTDENLSLNTYLGKHVEVHGSVQPTVEGSGTIMHVEDVTLLDAPASSSEDSSMDSSASAQFCGGIAGIQCKQAGTTCVDNPNDSCDPLHGGADCGGICVPTLDSSVSMSTVSSDTSSMMTSSRTSSVTSSKAASSVASSKVSSVASSAVSSVATGNEAALDPQIVIMAKGNYADAALWTQKYCTSHIAFCIPVHKNWYFKSFGATTSNLWHVEFGAAIIDELYQGPIVLNLVADTSAAAGVRDGQVRVQGKDIVIYKDWNDGNHFELIGDSRLKEAMNYMLAHMTLYTTGE